MEFVLHQWELHASDWLGFRDAGQYELRLFPLRVVLGAEDGEAKAAPLACELSGTFPITKPVGPGDDHELGGVRAERLPVNSREGGILVLFRPDRLFGDQRSGPGIRIVRTFTIAYPFSSRRRAGRSRSSVRSTSVDDSPQLE